jgi:hypothetical protein
VSDTTFTLLTFVAGIVLLGCAIGGLIAICTMLLSRRGSGLGSDEEFVRELLGYEPSRWPMNGGRRGDDEEAAT